MMDNDDDGELNMIRSLLRAEHRKDTSEMLEANENVLNALGKSRTRAMSNNPVSRLLRLRRHPVIVDESSSVREMVEKICSQRQSAALITKTSELGKKDLVGICSEVDVCMRLVCAQLNPDETKVSEIMTSKPQFVSPYDDANIVLQLMVKHKFRHLPVVDQDNDTEPICGLIDITQCLYDAISRIEKMRANQEKFVNAVRTVRLASVENDYEDQDATELANRTLDALISSVSPPLSVLLDSKRIVTIQRSQSALDAVLAMKDAKATAILVFEDHCESLCKSEMIGIITCKDIMQRLVGKGLDPQHTNVQQCMTSNPDTVDVHCNVKDALHIMQTEKYLHLPVVESTEIDDCAVRGVLNVLDCAVHAFSDSNMMTSRLLGEVGATIDDTRSNPSTSTPVKQHRDDAIRVTNVHPVTHEFGEASWRDNDSASAFSDVRSGGHRPESHSLYQEGVQSEFAIKIKDMDNGKVYRISSTMVHNFDDLQTHLEKVTKRNVQELLLTYIDEEGDEIQLSSNHALEEARQMVAQQQWKKLDMHLRSSLQPLPFWSKLELTDVQVLGVLGIASFAIGLIVISSMAWGSSSKSSSFKRRY